MEKRYAFFPGCVLTKAASEAQTSLLAVARALDVTLEEIPGWSCCGASHVQDIDPVAARVANARNLALGEKLNAPIMTSCSTCTLMLRTAKVELDSGRKDEYNTYLAAGGLTYSGSAPVTMLLWELAKDIPSWQGKVRKPLTGMKVAAFYGCHSLRPAPFIDFENASNPTSFEAVVRAMGATPVPFGKRLDCCGFHAVYSAEADALGMVGGIVDSAAKAGAQAIVTPCPLCQMQLDMYQEDALKATGVKTRVPALHLSQLLGMALDIPQADLGLDRNIVEPAFLKK